MPIPVVLAVSAASKSRLQNEQEIALTFNGRTIATLKRPEFYQHAKAERCARIYGTTDRNHPAVRTVLDSGDWLVGGDVSEPLVDADLLDEHCLSSCQLSARLTQMHADVVVAFHLEHALLTNAEQHLNKAITSVKTLGFSKPVFMLMWCSDSRASGSVSMATCVDQCRQLCTEAYVVPVVLPCATLHAGIREVQWHARCALLAGAHIYMACAGDLKAHGSSILRASPGLASLNFLECAI